MPVLIKRGHEPAIVRARASRRCPATWAPFPPRYRAAGGSSPRSAATSSSSAPGAESSTCCAVAARLALRDRTQRTMNLYTTVIRTYLIAHAPQVRVGAGPCRFGWDDLRLVTPKMAAPITGHASLRRVSGMTNTRHDFRRIRPRRGATSHVAWPRKAAACAWPCAAERGDLRAPLTATSGRWSRFFREYPRRRQRPRGDPWRGRGGQLRGHPRRAGQEQPSAWCSITAPPGSRKLAAEEGAETFCPDLGQSARMRTAAATMARTKALGEAAVLEGVSACRDPASVDRVRPGGRILQTDSRR